MYAQINDDTVTVGILPESARRLDTGAWVLGLRDADAATQQACGWFAVVDTERPADTDTTTHDSSVELVDGVPTVVWTERAKTDDELNPPTDPVAELQAQVAELTAALQALIGGD